MCGWEHHVILGAEPEEMMDVDLDLCVMTLLV